MQINLTQYAIWQTNIADSNIAVDTKIYATNNNEVQIYERLEDIYINGIGYSDIISVISIPLIIALFAFILEDSSFIRLFINKLYFIF
jgi:hypothetical protein